MTEPHYDAVVIGAGPAGATTARVAASHGLRVLLVDKRQELGAPIQCSGGVSVQALQAAEITPDPQWLLAPFYGFVVYDPAGARTQLDHGATDNAGEPLGYVVDRRRFDVALAAAAQAAGAELWLKTEATGFTVASNGVAAVELRRLGRLAHVKASVVIGADGVQSQVGRWAGLQTHVPLDGLASCLQYVVEGLPTDGRLEIITGHRWAPGGYAWVFPRGGDRAEVGVGVVRTLTEHDARWHLDHFVRHSFMADRLAGMRVVELSGGGVPLGAPLRHAYASHLLLVGDAARHVHPLTGAGIGPAVADGALAGRFVAQTIRDGVAPTHEHLSGYQALWQLATGQWLWPLSHERVAILRERDPARRDRRLHDTLTRYLSPRAAGGAW